MNPLAVLTFTAWCNELERLFTEGGMMIPLDLSQFQPHYRAGQTPIQALEEYVTGRATV